MAFQWNSSRKPSKKENMENTGKKTTTCTETKPKI